MYNLRLRPCCTGPCGCRALGEALHGRRSHAAGTLAAPPAPRRLQPTWCPSASPSPPLPPSTGWWGWTSPPVSGASLGPAPADEGLGASSTQERGQPFHSCWISFACGAKRETLKLCPSAGDIRRRNLLAPPACCPCAAALYLLDILVKLHTGFVLVGWDSQRRGECRIALCNRALPCKPSSSERWTGHVRLQWGQQSSRIVMAS